MCASTISNTTTTTCQEEVIGFVIGFVIRIVIVTGGQCLSDAWLLAIGCLIELFIATFIVQFILCRVEVNVFLLVSLFLFPKTLNVWLTVILKFNSFV